MTNQIFQKVYMMTLTIVFLFLSRNGLAQFPSLSPLAMVEQQIGSTNIRITYERPAIRGRTVFGSLVPYGKVWRTGAGNCTKIRFSQPVRIGETSVAGGTYSMFSVPDIESWTIILNRDTTAYGLSGYTPSNDIVRVNVPVRMTTRLYESFTIDIDVVPNNAMVYLSWANTQVGFLVETGIDSASMDFIKSSLLTKVSPNPDEYAMGAEYLYYLDRDLDFARILISQAITLQKTLWYYRLKIDILERQKKFSDGVAVADEAIKWIDSRQDLTPSEKAEYRGSYENRKSSLRRKISSK
jgi:hypothetical protein